MGKNCVGWDRVAEDDVEGNGSGIQEPHFDCSIVGRNT